MLPSLLTVVPTDCDSYTPKQAQDMVKATMHDADTMCAAFDSNAYLTRLEVDAKDNEYLKRQYKPLRVLIERLEKFSAKKISYGLAWFLTELTQHPASLILYAYAIHRCEIKNPVTMADFWKLFPRGIPHEKTLFEYWQAQKTKARPSENLLDSPETWA